MKSLLIAAMALPTITVSAHAITVYSPSNGTTVTSPFVVSASTTTCAGVPAVSMGYSLDSNTAVIEPTSFSASVSASAGSHVLHVKCWGKNVHAETLLNITVAAASTATNIKVNAPSNGASLSSPFTVSASTTSCAGKPAVSMGYSLDNGASVIEPTSFTASATAAPGAHVLHIKCWGEQVIGQVQLNINVAAAASAATPAISVPSGTYTTSQTVAMASPTAGSTIYFTTDGSAPTTASYKYAGPLAIAKSTTLQAVAVAPNMANSGLARASYVISSASKGAPIPSYATAEKQIQLLPNWRIKHDPATPGTSTGAMTLTSDPTQSGQSEKYYTSYTNSGGELYSISYGNDTYSKNFVYDVQVYIASGSSLVNLEMDNNQVMSNGDTVIYAFQCSGYSNTWEYTGNLGTPTSPSIHWLKSTAPCNPANWTRNTWHHIQIYTSRDDAGNVTYHSVWFDGVEAPINQTVNSAFSLNWGLGALVANFQVDGSGSGSATIYVDNFTQYRW
ncbi:chitobiase/beta-hexosaminidase C-terminal domain-containing protein [Occallatibacter savannae]|uniref:chitobiase/beta-hexosaminidase C-terminal domain-containing protein n=1 Tax=Occallatibacter savannae TaxID=1002691 RepID=UPI0013A546D8|nr:chitobiase/beta-hexosaminidase C-terminal domain-containing protein [Occallatibacter savannae]